MRLKELTITSHISCVGKSKSFYRKSSPRLRLQTNLSAQRRSLWNVLQPDKCKGTMPEMERREQDKSFFQVLSFIFLSSTTLYVLTRFLHAWQQLRHPAPLQTPPHYRACLVPRPSTPVHVCPLCSPFICLVRILFGLLSLSSATFQLSFALSARWCGSVNATCHCTGLGSAGAKEKRGWGVEGRGDAAMWALHFGCSGSFLLSTLIIISIMCASRMTIYQRDLCHAPFLCCQLLDLCWQPN